MRRGGSSLFTSSALPRSLLYGDSVTPIGFESATVLGFTLPQSPGSAALAVWEPRAPRAQRGAATAAVGAVNYRSPLGYYVPQNQVVKATPFSLRRALSGSSSGGGGGGEPGAPKGATAGHHAADAKRRRGAAAAGRGPAAVAGDEAPGWWHIDVSGYTRKGYQAGGGKEENQDRSIIVEPFGGDGQLLLGVLDGHGTFGHLVSSYLARHLPNLLHRHLSAPASRDAKNGAGGGPPPATAAAGPLLVKPAARAAWAPFGAAFADADRMLCGSGIDVLESGSTAVVCHLDLMTGRLATGWVGDSRAVLAVRPRGGGGGGGAWRVVALSDDHKPERPDEKVRILLNGGRVEQMQDSFGRKGGPHRVWFRHLAYPGLAMSRAFGDLPCRRLGVQPEPEVTVVDLGPAWASSGGRRGGGKRRPWGLGGGSGGGGGGGGEEELLLVVASDGVWEYMDNQEAVDVLTREPDAATGAAALVNEAVQRWRGVDPGYIDDITVVVARLRHGED